MCMPIYEYQLKIKVKSKRKSQLELVCQNVILINSKRIVKISELLLLSFLICLNNIYKYNIFTYS